MTNTCCESCILLWMTSSSERVFPSSCRTDFGAPNFHPYSGLYRAKPTLAAIQPAEMEMGVVMEIEYVIRISMDGNMEDHSLTEPLNRLFSFTTLHQHLLLSNVHIDLHDNSALRVCIYVYVCICVYVYDVCMYVCMISVLEILRMNAECDITCRTIASRRSKFEAKL